jgi:hypothetical protein
LGFAGHEFLQKSVAEHRQQAMGLLSPFRRYVSLFRR